jgi:cation transport regulator
LFTSGISDRLSPEFMALPRVRTEPLKDPQRRLDMPYKTISDLPKAQVDQYTQHQKEAFLKAFNNAYEEYGHDESRAFAVAHHAAKLAGKKEGHAT